MAAISASISASSHFLSSTSLPRDAAGPKRKISASPRPSVSQCRSLSLPKPFPLSRLNTFSQWGRRKSLNICVQASLAVLFYILLVMPLCMLCL